MMFFFFLIVIFWILDSKSLSDKNGSPKDTLFQEPGLPNYAKNYWFEKNGQVNDMRRLIDILWGDPRGGGGSAAWEDKKWENSAVTVGKPAVTFVKTQPEK